MVWGFLGDGIQMTRVPKPMASLLAQCSISCRCRASLIYVKSLRLGGAKNCSEEFWSRHPCWLSNNSLGGGGQKWKLLISCQSHHRQVRLFFLSWIGCDALYCYVILFFSSSFHGSIRLVIFFPRITSFFPRLKFQDEGDKISLPECLGIHFSWRQSDGLCTPCCASVCD